MARPGSSESDEAILRSLNAEPAAFAAFYRRHAARLLSDLAGRTNNPRLAAALCAETLAAALAGAHGFDPSRGSAAAWLDGLAEAELAHAERTGAARDRARLRLGLAPLEPPDADAGARFLADLEDELVAAARFRAERRSRRPALPRPSLRALAVAAAVVLVPLAVALALRSGEDSGSAAGARHAAGVPPNVRFRLLSMQRLERCAEPARRPLRDAGAVHRIALLSRRQRRPADALPFAPRMLPIGTFDPGSTRRASGVDVIPSHAVAASGECGAHVGPGLCLVAAEQEFRCFTAVDVAWGRAAARTAADTLVGIVPDGVEHVAIRGFGSPVGAEVVDNVYEAPADIPAGQGVELAFDGAGGGCRRTVAPELLAEVALLRDRPQRGDRLPPAAHDALAHWPLDAVVEDGARYWGGEAEVDFWAVPVVLHGRRGCAPARHVCIIAVDRRSSAAQCMLGGNRRGWSWWLGRLSAGRSVVFGTARDGVTGVRVGRHDVDAHGNVFGGVLPFPYRPRDVPRVKLIRGVGTVKPRVGIVDAGGPVGDVVGRLQARGYQTLGEITPGGTIEPRSIVYWWPSRAGQQDAFEVAEAAGVEEVAAVDDTDGIPRPVLDTAAPFVVVVGDR